MPIKINYCSTMLHNVYTWCDPHTPSIIMHKYTSIYIKIYNNSPLPGV